MKHGALSRVLVGIVVGGAIAACAQIEGLDGFQKVDCLDDCPDAANVPPPPPPMNVADTGVDAPTCPPCTGGTICDPDSLKCVECLPGKLACAPGYFCDPDPKLAYHCVLGCGVVDDCIKVLSMDAGLDADANVDAGGDGGLFSTYACCNNRCVDTAASDLNCGMCGHACGVGAACCASTCTDITSNATSCGACGKVCSNNNIASPTCTLGKCSGACDPGFDDCDNDKLTNGCESDIYNDPNKCGACNKSCSSNHVLATHCSVGTCDGACDTANGWADCNNNKLADGCEANITSNADHCGACPSACSSNNMMTRTCAASTCNGNCNAGYMDCNGNKLADGCETHTAADANNCGGCGVVCSSNNIPTPACTGSVCSGACSGNFADCDNNKQTNGCEVNLTTDPNHCGACMGKVCSSNHVTAACSGATPATANCQSGACDTGWGDCDNDKLTNGCEAAIGVDTNRCTNGAGAPGCMACTAGTRNCVAGVCSTGYGVTVTTIPFVDACAQAGSTSYLQADDDGVTTLLTLPFSFTFYGTARTQYWISADGYIDFSATPTVNFGHSCPAPTTTSTPFPAIFGYGRDLFTRGTVGPPASGGVCVATVGAAPNRKLVVTWEDAYIYADPTSHVTFSIMLEETTNRIDVVYQTLTSGNSIPADGTGAFLGLQSDTPAATPASSQATTYACNSTTPVLAAPMTLQYLP